MIANNESASSRCRRPGLKLVLLLGVVHFLQNAARGQIQTYSVFSFYQSGQSQVSILLPRKLKPNLRVLYLLPVEAGAGTTFGNPMLEVQRLRVPDTFNVACIQPKFTATPWYADNPFDLGKRQESHFLRCVVPFVNSLLPFARTAETFLVGFSKSGWGAFSLALRNPGSFAGIAVWDAPLMEARLDNKWDMPESFGSHENFNTYRIDRLLEGAPGSALRLRIVLLGYGLFRNQMLAAHDLMQSLRINHVFIDGPKREHSWGSGWLAEAIEMLLLEEPRSRVPYGR